MKKQNWEKEFDKFGEIWTTYFGVHFVVGKSANWNMPVEAKCDTKNIKLFIRNLLAEEKKNWAGEIKKIIERERMGIDNNKGTWGGEIEKVFPSMEYFLDEFEKEITNLF